MWSDVAVLVGDKLELDVLGIIQIALGIDHRVVKIRARFALRGRERRIDFVERSRDLEPFAAAAARGFERQRKSVLFGRVARGADVDDFLRAAGHDRHAGGDHRLARSDFVAHRIDRRRVWTDPGQSRFDDRACETRVSAKKP